MHEMHEIMQELHKLEEELSMTPGDEYHFSVYSADGIDMVAPWEGHDIGAKVRKNLAQKFSLARPVTQNFYTATHFAPCYHTLLHVQWHVRADKAQHHVMEALAVLNNLGAILAHGRMPAAPAAPAPAPAPAAPAPPPVAAVPAAAAVATAATLMNAARKALEASLDFMLENPHMFCTACPQLYWFPVGFHLEVKFPQDRRRPQQVDVPELCECTRDLSPGVLARHALRSPCANQAKASPGHPS